jgi:hypothetical protein
MRQWTDQDALSKGLNGEDQLGVDVPTVGLGRLLNRKAIDLHALKTGYYVPLF